MAKKVVKQKQPSLTDLVERAVRTTIDGVPGIRQVSEGEYLHCVLEALDVIVTGLEMRQEELNDESNASQES